MDPETFAFYLHQTPAEYAAACPPSLDQVLTDLQALHGDRAAQMGLAYLAQELYHYVAYTETLSGLAQQLQEAVQEAGAWHIDPDSSPLIPRIIDAQGQEIVTVMSLRPPAEVTAIARLIAAAPRLLRAAQIALAEHHDVGGHAWAPAVVTHCDVCDGLRAAIAQATGEEVI